jgi:hypothetical protein
LPFPRSKNWTKTVPPEPDAEEEEMWGISRKNGRMRAGGRFGGPKSRRFGKIRLAKLLSSIISTKYVEILFSPLSFPKSE